MKRIILLSLFPCLVWAAGNDINWSASLKGVESGEQVWLEKVPELAAAADVEQAIGLENALAEALSKNTQGALDTLSAVDGHAWPHMIGTDVVCSVPAENTTPVVEGFYQRTRLALLSTDKGAVCLWVLEASYEEWKAESSRKTK
ncbi:hypothetical protein [Pseudescherichia sp.]|uniref:hypothetical protein n=1 Tax=Pseudescherichia sp. TaxID=2055881 RepID=UPI00289B3C72|nr:hypothetical protein [Pseudescherichia sp.]